MFFLESLFIWCNYCVFVEVYYLYFILLVDKGSKDNEMRWGKKGYCIEYRYWEFREKNVDWKKVVLFFVFKNIVVYLGKNEKDIS